MKTLPEPAVYEKEFKYMPWGLLIEEVIRYVTVNAPKNARVLDLMCGPGYLLSKIHRKRKDLHLTGVDIDRRYILHAKKKYPAATFIQADSMHWKTNEQFDVVLCTAGLHHLPYEKHGPFIQKLSRLVTPRGICVMADPYVATYRTEMDRRLAAAELGYEYVKAVLEKKAPDDIVQATLDIMYNDVLPHGEYKTSVRRILPIARHYFGSVKRKKTWPKKKSDFGDYIFYLKKRI